jgi:SAM-dependent methyltransferase
MEDKAKGRYQGVEGQRYHSHKRAIPAQAEPWVARLRAAKLAPHIRLSDTVLEYGVGLGWNLAAVDCGRKLGFDVGEFLEPEVRARGIEFVADTARLADGSVDLVLCHHTLEHAWHPAEVLASIHRLLQAGGRLLVFVPYEKEKRFRHFDPGELNHHLYSWNVQTLANLVLDAGFNVQRAGLGPFGQERFAAILAARWHLGERGFRLLHWLANSLKRELEVRIVATKAVGAGR